MENSDWNELLDETETLPAFFLIRNLEYDTEHAQLPLESWRMSGRCIEVAHTFDDATKRVPKARLPRDPKKREALLLRFGTRSTLGDDGKWRDEPASFGYSLNPEAKNELILQGRATDQELFGESYTVLWICPTDVEQVIYFLMSHVNQYMAISPRPYDFLATMDAACTEEASASRFGAWDLFYFWRTYQDRICFACTEDDKFDDLLDLANEIRGGFAQRLKEMPNGPTDWDWERFEELLLK